MSEKTNDLIGGYSGEKGPLFKLAMVTALLTLVTLGIYRFWAKTRIRKYIWSSTSAGGDAFEYTGNGLEKFLGFLVAVVVLAIYLGLIQMGLGYLLFTYGLKRTTATEASLITMLEPLFNPVWVAIGYGEQPSTLAIIGGLIIVVALIVRILALRNTVVRQRKIEKLSSSS